MVLARLCVVVFFSSRRRHTRCYRDWSSDVCSSDLRVQRFIDAAFELLSDSEPGKDFTVQDVVEKSGQSLRSFYQYFGGKQELLLALFEESVRSTADELQGRISDERKPLERLHRFVVEYYAVCRPTKKGNKKRSPLALAEFAQQLMTANP